MEMEKKKSKILVIGGTGRIGRHIVKASIEAGHQTFLLVRKRSIDCENEEKASLLETFVSNGVTLLYGDILDTEKLTSAIKQVDVVISAVGHGSKEEPANQMKIVDAIKQAGNVKRFVPSEFGCDVEQVNVVLEPAKSLIATKVELRKIIREEGIPYTFVCTYFLHGFFLPRIGQAEATCPPTDKVFVLGDGNPKAIFVNEEDVGKYTIRAVDDPRTLNKILYVKPRQNIYSLNELVKLWEENIGKNLDKIYVSEFQVLKMIQDAPFPLNLQLVMAHSAFINGEQTKDEMDPTVGVEATDIYPDIKYTTVAEFLEGLKEEELVHH